MSARTAWTIGNENFPSVRSSAKPLLVVYFRNYINIEVRRKRTTFSYLSALKISVVNPNLEVDSYEVDKWNIVTT